MSEHTLKPCPYALDGWFYQGCPRDMRGLAGQRCADCPGPPTDEQLAQAAVDERPTWRDSPEYRRGYQAAIAHMAKLGRRRS